MPSLEANQLLLAAADACDSKKAEDIVILELDPTESSLTDYFLICNGTNERQNAAIADEIELRLKREFGVYPNSVEGRRQGEWILMDYVDFVVHVFMPEKRSYYGLERLKKSATVLSAEDLDGRVKTAVAELRSKGGTGRSAASDDGREAPQRRVGSKVGRKSSAKVAEALASAKPAKGAAKKASVASKSEPRAAKKAAAKLAGKAASKPSAAKSASARAAGKSPAKKSVSPAKKKAAK